MKRPHFALPEIYDGSLSYYEVLRKLIKSMNVIIDNLNKIPEQIANEAKARLLGDQNLQQNINAEKNAREQADTELQNAINTEKSAREQADQEIREGVSDKIGEIKGDLANKLPKSPTNWEPWTAEEQAAARERMGIPGNYELIENITLTDDISEIIRDKDTFGNQYSMKNLLLFVSAGITTLKMSIRIEINDQYIIESESIGDNNYEYKYICRFDINNGILSTFLIGNRGSIQNRFAVNSSIMGMTAFIDTIKSVKLRITNPIEGATIKIYGVRA